MLSYNFYMANSLILAIGSFIGSLFFILLMVKNILHVKRLKEKGDKK